MRPNAIHEVQGSMDATLFERLLFEDESTTLDFKKDQYPFANASPEAKSELLKDILGFVNAWRRSEAYILIGVEEVRGGRSNVPGVSEHLPDHSLQQFVNSLTSQPVQFAYEAFEFESKQVGIIRIEQQPRPLFLLRDFGKLRKNEVYVRRGSSTDPTRPASPDEIARMGLASNPLPDADLAVEFADAEKEICLGIHTAWAAELCEMPQPKDVPDLRRPRQSNPFGINLGPIHDFAMDARGETLNEDFYRESAIYEFVKRLVRPVRLVVTNKGRVAAHNVRVEITVAAVPGIAIVDDSDLPDTPRRTRSQFEVAQRTFKKIRPAIRHAGAIYIDASNDRFRLEVDCGSLQPGRRFWLRRLLTICLSREPWN
jgi:hypothetical protein